MTFTMEQIEEAMEDGTIGFCIVCGEEHDGIESDAREYPCEVCGTDSVYGAEEILLMGMVE